MKTCRLCDQPVRLSRNIYCSKACYDARPTLRQEIRQCQSCGKDYTPKHRHQKFCAAWCFPVGTRSAAISRGRKKRLELIRMQRFHADIQRLPQRLTREDLLAVMAQVYRRGYLAGLQTRWKAKKAA